MTLRMNTELDELRSHGMMGEAVRNFYWDSCLFSFRISERKSSPNYKADFLLKSPCQLPLVFISFWKYICDCFSNKQIALVMFAKRAFTFSLFGVSV